ncbi:recombinase family protein [Xanthobacter sp. V7C-4]|uniref:recombinase family protein n=1 Tax=Xanthobacter autotrophicus (strain ATCC BAA-1158 / Py2) TaxID=78245 RepID=UPI00372632AD
MGMLVGYARTSTTEQEAGLEAQRRDLLQAGCGKVFAEHVSSVGDRVELARVVEFVREGDTVVVTKIDRLARSTINLWDIVRDLDAKGVGLALKARSDMAPTAVQKMALMGSVGMRSVLRVGLAAAPEGHSSDDHARDEQPVAPQRAKPFDRC